MHAISDPPNKII